jgi:hypothetical protein
MAYITKKETERAATNQARKVHGTSTSGAVRFASSKFSLFLGPWLQEVTLTFLPNMQAHRHGFLCDGDMSKFGGIGSVEPRICSIFDDNATLFSKDLSLPTCTTV